MSESFSAPSMTTAELATTTQVEVTSMPETLLTRPASEVLQSEQDVVAAVDAAIQNKIVEVTPITSAQEAPAGAYVAHALTEAKEGEVVDPQGNLIKAHRNSTDTVFLYPGQFTWATHEGEIKEATTAHARVVESINRQQEIAPWYLDKSNQLIQKIANNDPVSELFVLSGIEDKQLEVINFSEHVSVTEEKAALFTQAVELVLNAAGPGVLGSIEGIAIVSDAELNGVRDPNKTTKHALAIYENYSGVIRLSDTLFTEDIEKEDRYGLEEAKHKILTTLVHELGHALQNAHHNTFAKAVGWKSQDTVKQDEQGNKSYKTDYVLGEPAAQQPKVIDGKVTYIPLEEVTQGQEEVQVQPNTWYGATHPDEDFAESVVPYVLDGRDTLSLDPVRRNAVNATAARRTMQNVQHGPYKMRMQKIDLQTATKKPLKPVEPTHLYVLPGARISPIQEVK